MSPPVAAARAANKKPPVSSPGLSPHLQRLEDEAIHILREVVAEFRRPVMLYSVGKDSSVMLHLARKAFFPAPPPFPFLHIASGWDFRALIEHRDRMAAQYGLDLLVHANEEAARDGVNPFETETGEYSRLMLTEALKEALDIARLRCRLRRRPARRGEGARQGAHLLASLGRPRLGSAQPAARAVAAVQHAARRRRHDAGLPACRTGPSSTSGPTSRPKRSRSCRSISRPTAGWSSATAT